MATELYPPGVLEPGEIPPELLNGLEHNGNGTPHDDEDPVVDIVINNVVCTFNTRCHLNLKKIALEGCHVEFKQEQSKCVFADAEYENEATPIHREHLVIWENHMYRSNKFMLVKPQILSCLSLRGSPERIGLHEDDSHRAARRFARRLQRLGFNVRFANFRVVNVLGTCILPFRIKITNFSKEHREKASYEPELHPGVTYRIVDPKATLKIFSTGSITVTAPCVANVQSAIEHIYPLVIEHKAEDSEIDADTLMREQKYLSGKSTIVRTRSRPQKRYHCKESSDEEDLDSSDEECYSSDESFD